MEGKDARERFDRALDEMQLAMCETRFALWDMRTTDGQSPCLETRISQYGQSISATAGIRFSFDRCGRPAHLAPDVERQLFQMAREALLNSIRHSEASDVGVVLEFQADLLRLTVKDNGRGFDAGNVKSGGHWGLLGMYERAAGLGGSCTVSSSPGRGTTVTMELPKVRRKPRSPKDSMTYDQAGTEFKKPNAGTNSDSSSLRR